MVIEWRKPIFFTFFRRIIHFIFRHIITIPRLNLLIIHWPQSHLKQLWWNDRVIRNRIFLAINHDCMSPREHELRVFRIIWIKCTILRQYNIHIIWLQCLKLRISIRARSTKRSASGKIPPIREPVITPLLYNRSRINIILIIESIRALALSRLNKQFGAARARKIELRIHVTIFYMDKKILFTNTRHILIDHDSGFCTLRPLMRIKAQLVWSAVSRISHLKFHVKRCGRYIHHKAYCHFLKRK